MRDTAARDEWSEIHISAPTKGTCPLCATRHEKQAPHDRDSLYYILHFYKANKRLPLWQDAMSHCSELTKAAAYAELARRGGRRFAPDTDGK